MISPREAASRPVVLRLWMLLVLLVVPAALTWLLRPAGPRPGPPVAATGASVVGPESSSTLYPATHPGPWGVLELTPMVIQPSARHVPPDHYAPAPLLWRLGSLPSAEVPAWLAEQGLPAELVRTARTDNVSAGLVLQPSPELVRSLNPAQRGRLYRDLLEREFGNAAFFGNQRWSPAQWQETRAGLSPGVRDVVAAMVFPAVEGDDVHFWDLRAAMHFLPSERDRLALTRIYHQQRTYLLTLIVDAATPVQEMTDYWRLPSTRRQILPMLESLTHLPAPSRIDALHVMTPFIRELSYTYPVTALDDTRGDPPDCFWTCANFDRPAGHPEIRGDEAATFLMANYAPFVGRPEFGDLLILRTAADEAIHAAVYIAADILFTKNGQHPLVPWIFMAREDLLRIYDHAAPARSLWVRRKSR